MQRETQRRKGTRDAQQRWLERHTKERSGTHGGACVEARVFAGGKPVRSSGGRILRAGIGDECGDAGASNRVQRPRERLSQKWRQHLGLAEQIYRPVPM